jgi:hypothetical protein
VIYVVGGHELVHGGQVALVPCLFEVAADESLVLLCWHGIFSMAVLNNESTIHVNRGLAHPQMSYLGGASFGEFTFLRGWVNKEYPPPRPYHARRRGAIMQHWVAREEGGL